MRIYTKKGDKGQTSLANGERVSKSNESVDLYGTVDELNSLVGLVVSQMENYPEEVEKLTKIQNLLFEIGSELAGFRVNSEESHVQEEDIQFLEKAIDFYDSKIPPLKNFVLPGGGFVAACLHITRTVTRKLERKIVKAMEDGVCIHSNILKYFNRLSDYFFVQARFINYLEKRNESIWHSSKSTLR